MTAASTTEGVRGVTVLGATGSIGCNTLDVLRRHRDRFSVFALTAHRQVDRLHMQCLEFAPRFAVMTDAGAARELAQRLGTGTATEVLSDSGALEFVAGHESSSIVMAAIVGAAGLAPVRAAVRAGKRVLLANKEPLVMAGEIVMREAQAAGAELLPIDSEHNAVFQCMPAGYRTGERGAGVRRIVLTCSGGPFLNHSDAELSRVTPAEACRHPRWSMGPKISVDSATLMNKGLEVIEACRLFNLSPGNVEIVIHPQSVVHSLVEYEDGSVLAQLGNPDMRTPIAHALGFPHRMESGATPLDLSAIARLDFQAPDRRQFPCLDLAYGAAREGGTIPAVLNAANEMAVQAFLDGRIGFADIATVIEHTLDRAVRADGTDIEFVLAADAWARAEANTCIARRSAEINRMAS
jgi:1-deoxy-D-xylulose-5-phosphate reductoisomerase